MVLFLHSRAYGQITGDVCEDPIVVSDLPFYAELNTADFSDDYGSSSIPDPGPWPLFPNGLDKTWVNGRDIVFEYVADTTMLIEIELSELQNEMAIYVIQDCPFAYTMGFDRLMTGNHLVLSNFQVYSGLSYYVLATTPSPSFFANTPFNINIRPQDTQDCVDANANFGDFCDDGDPTTLNDRYRTDCQCTGDATVVGAICQNPIAINSLPFIQSGSLEDYGNYYSETDIAPTVPDYIHGAEIDDDDINGNEVVFSYTPGEDQMIDINLGRIKNLSLYVFKGCEFSSTHAIFNPDNQYDFCDFSEIPLLADSTYYFVVSTNSDSPTSDSYTSNFHIEVRQTGVFDCEEEQLNINGRCDDGDTMTFPDIIDAECECVGNPTMPGDICGNPIYITTLPFHASDTVAKYGNNYLDIDYPNQTSYSRWGFNRPEVVFTYTPQRDEIINLDLQFYGISGMYVLTGCPFDTVINANYGGFDVYDRHIEDLNVSSGVTYYIVITGENIDFPDQLFTLDIELEWALCPELGKYVYQLCDDEDITTLRDSITYDCECAGKPTIPGTFCPNPIEISSVPITLNDSIYYYGNMYSNSDLPQNEPAVIGHDDNNTYLNGNEVIYSYTPTRDEIIRIDPINWESLTGIYVITGCPFDSTVAITENHGYGPKKIDSLYLSEGTTYHIVIASGWTNDDNMKFNIQIDLLSAYCDELDVPVYSPCDDGIETTVDKINENCECIGTPTIPGQFCGNPLPIASLPFATTDTVNGYGDNYGPADFPPLAPNAITNDDSNPGNRLNIDAPEVVYSYTPSENEFLTMTLSNTLTFNSDALFVFTGCPFELTEAYNIGQGSSADLVITPLPVLAGTTYYIVVSPYYSLQPRDFTLTIESTHWDCFDLQLDFGASCDDGDPDTENDVVTDSCTCAGTPIDYNCVNTQKYPVYNVSPDLYGEETPIGTCIRFNEYSQIMDVYNGNSYAFAGVINDTGQLAHITVRRDSVNGPVLGTGVSPLIVTAVSDADLFVHWNKNADCDTYQAGYYCVDGNMVCLSCPALIDCEGVINGDAIVGTPCDDGDPNTVRDVWNGNCECVGEDPIPMNICETAVALECNGEAITYQALDGVEYYEGECFSGTNGFWFTFTGNGGNIDVNIATSFFFNVALFEGECDALNQIDCVMYSDEPEILSIPNSIPGQTYYVYLAEGSGIDVTTGSVSVSLTCEVLLNGSVDGNPNCGNRPATVFFYEPGTNILVSQKTTLIDQDGNFEIQDPPVGTYDIILDPHLCLNIGIPDYTVSNDYNSLDFGQLEPSDINNDNTINTIDVSYVNLSFGKSVGDIFYDIRADNNCDGTVTITDLSVLNMSFSKFGATAPLVDDQESR